MAQPVQLFELAAQQARWLAVRQSAVAANIANVNTPGYGAVDIAPFQSVLDNTRVTMASTATGHLSASGSQAGYGIHKVGDPDLLPSGNSVVMEEELIKASEVRRAFELNTAIVKAFHRMMMMNTRA